MVISDAEPTGWRWRRAINDGGRNSGREREYLSLQELQYRERRGILIIMREKILREKELDELRDLGVLKFREEVD